MSKIRFTCFGCGCELQNTDPGGISLPQYLQYIFPSPQYVSYTEQARFL